MGLLQIQTITKHSLITIILIGAVIYAIPALITAAFKKKLSAELRYKLTVLFFLGLFVAGLATESYPVAIIGFTLGVFKCIVYNIPLISKMPQVQVSITEQPKRDCLYYHGKELRFSDEEFTAILEKHFTFYKQLRIYDREKFLHRLKAFMHSKTFIINDESGYKEMPVLLSATAIQLSFGLDRYMLPSFPVINIFPAEFLRTEPVLTFLTGNVSDNRINISWKHFLIGYQIPDNGENVGLHEMAHAYYYQNFATEHDTDHGFKRDFSIYDMCCDKAYVDEKISESRLYTDYGLTNMQEFWAESTEIFFERPVMMQQKYPDLYDAMCSVLNQYPAMKSA